ncbi:hypothetical protein J3458_016234 [Metarhizium acridum]|uniref:uncharacterized protein n=1 Tax=Metarhizium acridum TaxID=92637 RepID=UPI001C6C4131|nr:hypothetical protein J3458_016234 [Metarhizium acridum]
MLSPPLPTRPPELTKPTHFAVIDGPAVTFEFSTPQPHPKNWIGIWHDYYGGPENNTWIQDQLTWAWAEGTHGSAQVDISDLPPGRYLAYFLGERSYKWLAQPVEVFISRADSMRFIPDDFTTHNGRVGDSFSADISGLLTNVKNGNITYAVIPPSNADWVSISSKGVIGGVPKHSGLSKFSIRATSADNNTAVLPVAVPVARRHKPLSRSWPRKTSTFVALQESYFHDGLRLAKALGWNAWQSKDVSHPLAVPRSAGCTARSRPGAPSASTSTASDRQLLVWNVHLNNAPYGPYDLCFTNYSTNYIQRSRGVGAPRPARLRDCAPAQGIQVVPQARVSGAPPDPGRRLQLPLPPSTTTRRPRDLHCKGREDPFPWPVSRRTVLDGKWTDSFREVYRNAWKVPGNTWSPIRKVNGDRPRAHGSDRFHLPQEIEDAPLRRRRRRRTRSRSRTMQITSGRRTMLRF